MSGISAQNDSKNFESDVGTSVESIGQGLWISLPNLDTIRTSAVPPAQ